MTDHRAKIKISLASAKISLASAKISLASAEIGARLNESAPLKARHVVAPTNRSLMSVHLDRAVLDSILAEELTAFHAPHTVTPQQQE